GYRYVPKNACVGRSPKPLQNRCSTCVLASPALGCRQLRLTTPRYTCHRMKLCRMRATSSNSSQRHVHVALLSIRFWNEQTSLRCSLSAWTRALRFMEAQVLVVEDDP